MFRGAILRIGIDRSFRPGLCGGALVHRTLEASLERLPHRAEIVARRDPDDVVAAVLRLHRTGRVEHDAGCDRRLAHRMRDIEALDATWRCFELQQFGEPGPSA